jgi:uncharacterized protein YjbK
MTVKEYTEEFYKLNIRAGQREKDDEKVSRYINGLRYEIQDEINMMTVRTVEDAYQIVLEGRREVGQEEKPVKQRKKSKQR